jgi:folate-binding protein YgfZ
LRKNKEFKEMGSSLLADRGIIVVAGEEAEAFLHRLVTNDMLDMAAGEARYAGLLTPQGKLLFDFIVVPLPQGARAGFYLDCLRPQAADLAKRLTFHKLRAKITIEDRSSELGVAAFWDAAPPAVAEATVYRDPRAAGLGYRMIAAHGVLAGIAPANPANYDSHRIACGVPQGGLDFAYGDAFAHDADLDLLNGVDFKKGCYVGQEVVSRVHFRKSARKRIVRVHFDGPAPAAGAEITAGESVIGQIGSVAGADGLALLRIDRIEDAKKAGLPLKAGATPVEADVPAELLEGAAGAEKLL